MLFTFYCRDRANHEAVRQANRPEHLAYLEQASEQLQRTPRPLPHMQLNPAVRDIHDFRFEDFELAGYDPYPAIKAPIAV